jgi:hypothetical protein
MDCSNWYNNAGVWSAIGVWFGAVVALLGLIGLYYYTRYTGRIMVAAEATMRATIAPILVLERVHEGAEVSDLRFRLMNVGKGPALHVLYWAMYRPSDFPQPHSRFKEEKPDALGTIMPTIGESSSKEFSVSRPLSGEHLFLHIETRDASDFVHTYGMLYKVTGVGNEFETHWWTNRIVTSPQRPSTFWSRLIAWLNATQNADNY